MDSHTLDLPQLLVRRGQLDERGVKLGNSMSKRREKLIPAPVRALRRRRTAARADYNPPRSVPSVYQKAIGGFLYTLALVLAYAFHPEAFRLKAQAVEHA